MPTATKIKQELIAIGYKAVGFDVTLQGVIPAPYNGKKPGKEKVDIVDFWCEPQDFLDKKTENFAALTVIKKLDLQHRGLHVFNKRLILRAVTAEHVPEKKGGRDKTTPE